MAKLARLHLTVRSFRLRQRRWQDAAMLVLAVWLFVSPWVLLPSLGARGVQGGAQGSGEGGAGAIIGTSWSCWVLGAVIALIAALALSGHRRLRWIVIAAGVWILITPWVFGLLGHAIATTPGMPGMSGFALLLLVIPGTGGAVWDNWLVGAALAALAVWAIATEPTTITRVHEEIRS